MSKLQTLKSLKKSSDYDADDDDMMMMTTMLMTKPLRFSSAHSKIRRVTKTESFCI